MAGRLGELLVRDSIINIDQLKKAQEEQRKIFHEVLTGDVEPIGEGVSELRIDHGPGYRVYFVQRGQTLVVLLAGGDKRTQSRDIQRALELARNL